jgi:hypothetical protein
MVKSATFWLEDWLKKNCSDCFRTGLLRDSMQQSLKTNLSGVRQREQVKVNYTIADQMLELVRANQNNC